MSPPKRRASGAALAPPPDKPPQASPLLHPFHPLRRSTCSVTAGQSVVHFVQSDINLALILRPYTAPLAITSKILIEIEKTIARHKLISIKYIPYRPLL